MIEHPLLEYILSSYNKENFIGVFFISPENIVYRWCSPWCSPIIDTRIIDIRPKRVKVDFTRFDRISYFSLFEDDKKDLVFTSYFSKNFYAQFYKLNKDYEKFFRLSKMSKDWD